MGVQDHVLADVLMLAALRIHQVRPSGSTGVTRLGENGGRSW